MSSIPWIISLLLLLVFSSYLSNGNPYLDIEPCQIDRCRLPYCYCSNQSIPGKLTVRETPQFIAISINGPLEEKLYQLLKDLFFSRKYSNPDGLNSNSDEWLQLRFCLLQVVRSAQLYSFKVMWKLIIVY